MYMQALIEYMFVCLLTVAIRSWALRFDVDCSVCLPLQPWKRVAPVQGAISKMATTIGWICSIQRVGRVKWRKFAQSLSTGNYRWDHAKKSENKTNRKCSLWKFVHCILIKLLIVQRCVCDVDRNINLSIFSNLCVLIGVRNLAISITN